MGQKTHPIGFRIGVKSDSKSSSYAFDDIHGLTSRWAISNNANISNYSDLSHRDRIIKKLTEDFIEEDGYIVNKVIVHRTQSYTGVYVDALQLSEPAQYYLPQSQSVTSKYKVSNMKVLEDLISRYVEHSGQVTVQFVKLVFKDESSLQLNKNPNDVDLIKVINILTKGCIPCSALLAKIISFNMSKGGRRERETMRLIVKYRTLTKQISPFKGYYIKLKGRIGGSERSRVVRYRSGAMPRHTVSAGIDYGFSEVNTISGKVSVTVLAYFS